MGLVAWIFTGASSDAWTSTTPPASRPRDSTPAFDARVTSVPLYGAAIVTGQNTVPSVAFVSPTGPVGGAPSPPPKPPMRADPRSSEAPDSTDSKASGHPRSAVVGKVRGASRISPAFSDTAPEMNG